MQMDEQGPLAVPVLSVFICRRLFLRTGTGQSKLRHTLQHRSWAHHGGDPASIRRGPTRATAASYMTPRTAGDNISSTSVCLQLIRRLGSHSIFSLARFGHSLGNFEGGFISIGIKWENRYKCTKMRLGQRYSPAQPYLGLCPFIPLFFQLRTANAMTD